MPGFFAGFHLVNYAYAHLSNCSLLEDMTRNDSLSAGAKSDRFLVVSVNKLRSDTPATWNHSYISLRFGVKEILSFCCSFVSIRAFEKIDL